MAERIDRRRFLKMGTSVVLGAVAGKTIAGKLIEAENEKQQRLQNLREELQEIKVEQDKNLLGDCFNEDMLKRLYRVEPGGLEQCKFERDHWYREYKQKQGVNPNL